MFYIKYFISIISFVLFTANNSFASQDVRLLCERHRTEWNWVEYRISLKNTSSHTLFNPEIHYYAANTELIVDVDYATYPYSVTTSTTKVGGMLDIKFSLHGHLNPQKKLDINFRLHRQNWTSIDFTKDWSYTQNASISEPNYFMTVYDATHKILWGDDPIYGNHNTGDVITWTDRDVNRTITRYDRTKNEIIPAGRFWLFKDTPLSPKERDLLAQRGISKLSIGKSRGKIVAVFKSDSSIQKKAIDSLIAGFYNAIPVADAVPIKVELTNEDLYSETEVCDTNQTCHKEVSVRTDFETDVRCWEDVSIDDCISTVHACGGENIGVARGFLVATVAKDSLECLGKSKNIENLDIAREATPSNDKGREAVHIDVLQNSEEWLNALQQNRADLDWLKGVEYTGDSILVGVYDTPIDFDHPDFNEYDSLGQIHPRIMQENEFHGISYDTAKNKMLNFIKLKNGGRTTVADYHGTGDAGFIGGNGNASPSGSFKYRGVAPKVHFYVGEMKTINQIGHVVNHSHTNDRGWYMNADFSIDRAIFNNWKSDCLGKSSCIEGDTIVKTAVYSAHNSGHSSDDPTRAQLGYYSIYTNAKNPIVVGNITAKEKVRAFSSSMGPTWDGRIKPDVMAPGVSDQIIVDEKHPFEIQIDYIKIYRESESTPYINIDFDKNNLELFIPADNYYTSCNIITLPDNRKVFDCKASDFDLRTKMLRPQLFISWILKKGTKVFPTDEFEIRYRKISGADSVNDIFGTIRFATCTLDIQNCPSAFNGDEPKNYVIWPLSNQFETVRKKLIEIDTVQTVYYLRIDFNFERGTITPDACHKDSCGYRYLGAGGTSQSAPYVSGVAALLYQKFHKQTGDPLDKHSMRNSTTKALLIHSAIDMEDSEKAHFACNPDIGAAHNDGKCYFTPYGKGPDFATGWGYVDGKGALDLISGYDSTTKEFPKFKEIEIGNGIEKRWTIKIDSTRKRLRTTLVWDDAPGKNSTDKKKFKEKKLVNDLDMYLISPSGKYYYPWRLDTLPTDLIYPPKSNNVSGGYENIHLNDIRDAYNNCSSSALLDFICFDHLNNVEVVDVENPELGKWQIVVLGHSVTEFNNDSLNAQVATLVSDLPLNETNKFNAVNSCKVTNGYAPQTDYRCTYELGKDMLYHITFHDSTFSGNGDDIVLTDAEGRNIGIYVGDELAGKTIKVKSSKLTVTLHSDNDNSQGWGFDITRIRSVNQAILKMPFEVTKKKRRTP